MLLRIGVVRSIETLLGGDEVQQELGLALLQNMSPYVNSHTAIMSCGFLQRLPSYFHGA